MNLIQHVKTLHYTTEAVITRKDDFSKEQVLDAHRILCQEVDAMALICGKLPK